jgi:hypothetical protein
MYGMTRRSFTRAGAILLAGCGGGDAIGAAPWPVLTIGQETGPVAQLHGYLSGIAEGLDPYLVLALKPKFWRLGRWDLHVAAKNAGAKTQIVLSDALGQAPYQNWAGYEAGLRALAAQSVQGPRVDYWDVSNEPDANWRGTPDQFLELLHRTYHVLRSFDPTAKLVMPSLTRFDPIILNWALDYVAAQGLNYSAVSWHEFDTPSDVATHAANARAMFAARGLSMEIHINEVASGQHHLIPGWSLAWLAAMEQADVQWSNLACWHRESGVGDPSECAKGLDGLLTASQTNTQAPYWVHKAYADMAGMRLAVSSPSAGIVALASRDANAVRAIIGKYSCGQAGRWCLFSDRAVQDTPFGSSSINLRVQGYPWAVARVRTAVIPYSNSSVAVSAPVYSAPVSYPVRFGVVTVPVSNLADGSVRLVFIEK